MLGSRIYHVLYWLHRYLFNDCHFDWEASLLLYNYTVLNFFIIKKIYIFKRYYAINKPLYTQRLTANKKIVSIVVCLLLGLIWPVLPLFGWSYYTLEGGLTSCTVEWSERSFNVISYNVVIWVGGFFVPLIIIVYTNSKVIFLIYL